VVQLYQNGDVMVIRALGCPSQVLAGASEKVAVVPLPQRRHGHAHPARAEHGGRGQHSLHIGPIADPDMPAQARELEAPTLATLTAPIEQAGRVAVSMLLSLLTDRLSDQTQRRCVVLPTHLTVRESSGPIG
jgi:hypothetical protein